MFSAQHERLLTKLGQDVSLARRRRRMTQASVAERSEVSQSTVRRLEAGDEGVSIGALLRVLSVFDLQGRLGELADAVHDQTGLTLIHADLPHRMSRAAPRKVRPTAQEKTAGFGVEAL